MAPTKSTDFKFETYQRLTDIAKNRLFSIKLTVEKLFAQTEPLSVVQLKTLNGYMTELQKKKDDFESNLQRILTVALEENVIESVSRDQDDINDLFILISSHIESMTPANESKNDGDIVSANNGSISCTHSQVRLPKFELPKFSGELTTWTSFINLFDTTIHHNDSLSDVMKFQYLLSALDKEPLNLIRSLTITALNYTIAYNIIRDRYHNDRRLQLVHLNNLLDLPQITSSHISGVRQFVNMFNENTQALVALTCEISNSDPLMVATLLRKMDLDLRTRLESFRSTSCNLNKHTLPTTKEIIDFLTTACTNLEDATLSNCIQKQTFRSGKPTVNKPHFFPNKPIGSYHASNYMTSPIPCMVTTQPFPYTNNTMETKMPCFACNQTSHKIYTCTDFKNKTPQERFQLVKQNRKCVSCLGAHDTKSCQSQSNCKMCNKRHHTLLHFDGNKPQLRENHDPPVSGKSSENKSKSKSDSIIPVLSFQNSLPSSNTTTTVLLGTALVQLCSPEGISHVFRALLDSGSMCNLISEYAANILNIQRQKSSVQISGIDQHVSSNKGQIIVDFKTLSGQTIAFNEPALILDKLTVDLPRAPLSNDLLNQMKSYTLADPTFHIPSRIDVVIGGSLFPQLLTQEKFSLGQNKPYVLGTHLGYVLIGTAPCISTHSKPSMSAPSTSLNVCLHSTSEADLHNSIQRFWLQEEPPVRSRKTHEEELCDKHFNETHTRDTNGRYIVRLPFKDSSTVLGESKTSAQIRLHAMERKFKSNTRFASLYHDFMDEYLSLGHMSECNDINLSHPHYFLPHHGVLKESSSTTKLRTVFDASCKTSSGTSLNDILLTGPKLQNNICNLLMQFRRHNVVFCCDIRQMYRQIVVHPDDRNFQLILWRTQSDESSSTYQLNTVTYGMNSSPYLAIRTLHQLTDDEGQSFSDAAHVLRNHSYVDDIITGADTESEAIMLQEQLISLLSKGCFELRKWVSNSPTLLCNLPETHLESPKFLDNSETPHFKVLGLQWSPTTDAFSYNVQTPATDKASTKRSVLSTIAQIYDPCGFLVPFIMLAKCFMQLLWTKGLSWDTTLPSDLSSQWNCFCDNIQWLSNISIPRSFGLSSSCNIELHEFCDASERGYAAVIYLRCLSLTQNVSIKLLMAKSRVAPLKRVTIPRLELCAAHLLSQIISHCKSIFPDKFSSSNIYLWSDSTITLTWLQTPPYRLKTYIANRVSQIQEFAPIECWKHISSEDNPADCASRGLLVSQLVNHQLWWNGPSWLSLPPCSWPASKFTPLTLDASHEIKESPLNVLTISPQEEWSVLTKFSSWTKLQRVMAYVLRFIHNCRNSSHRCEYLSTQELQESQLKIFSLVQQSTFPEDLSLLFNQKDCSKRIQRLNPFLDSNNLIRVGGWLTHLLVPYDTRHPILFPKHHHVVNLLIDHYHRQNLHAGPKLVQSLLSKHVWILCARNVIRSRIFRCLTCFRHRPRNTTPLMGDLPSCRVNPARPFLSTGVDFGGPYNVKVTHLRFLRLIKVYICIFVCMVTKAVHIEVVTDLSTEAFIAALTRFTSRRGMCSDIYSDCGTNFIGANLLLRNIIKSAIRNSESQKKIQCFASHHNIKFHFNPPAAPHHGGLWESAIKSVKHHLKRVMGETILTLPEFMTLTVRIESILNSRPLTPLSSDPSDLAVLTPGHFLTGAPLVSMPEQDFTDIPTNRLKHWQLTQKFFQSIWKKWILEYLHTLQQRCKWTSNCKNIKVGDLLLINSSSTPLQWPLARDVKVFPGDDGVVRVVKVKTSTSEFIRPVTKLCPLPIEEETVEVKTLQGGR